MKRLFALSLMLTASLASATPEDDAKAVVQKSLIAPLRAKEEKHSRFSRARLPAQVRRVRMLDSEPKKDSQGSEFLTFAVDAKHGFGELDDDGEVKADAWRKDVITGCVYPESGEVFVKKGEKLFGAGLLLGKKTSAAAEHVCKAGGEQVAAK